LKIKKRDVLRFFCFASHVFSNYAGVVIICDNVCTVPSGYVMLMERLGSPRIDFSVLQNEIQEAGFRLVVGHDFKERLDLSNPSDDVVKFLRLVTDRSEREIRAAIDDIFGQPNMAFCSKKLAIFSK